MHIPILIKQFCPQKGLLLKEINQIDIIAALKYQI